MKSNENNIQMYLHCSKCIKKWKEEDVGEISPQDYQKIQIGWTKEGIQVWCVRHDCNILHVDFEGTKHPADTTRLKK